MLVEDLHVLARDILDATIGMMHQPRRQVPALRGCRDRQPDGLHVVQRPAQHLAQIRIENHRQVDELARQPDVGDVRHPQLVDASPRHPARQVQVHL